VRQHAHGRMVLTVREGVHGGRDTVRCYTGQRREVRQVVRGSAGLKRQKCRRNIVELNRFAVDAERRR
jgi:hypothetical protein